MSTFARPVTAEELFRMPRDKRRELVNGEVREMSPSGFEHGALTHRLGQLLGNHVDGARLGIVVGAETGFRLATNPDTVRGADVAFVRTERLPASRLPTGYWPGAPDLAVEVVSPNDTLQEVEEKVDDYLTAGTLMVWVVNPRRQTITIHRPGRDPAILRLGDHVDGEDVLPGFRCAVADVFA